LNVLAEFSGAWYGTIYSIRDFAIVVEKIDHQSANLIYAWGPHKFHNRDTAGWIGAKGYVEGDTLRFNLAGNDYAITCTLLLDGNLEVVWRNKNEALRSTFTRWNNPSWETSTPMNQEESNLAREQHRMSVERDIAEVYSDYSGEIQQFFHFGRERA
jgi:hypothetical protein